MCGYIALLRKAYLFTPYNFIGKWELFTYVDLFVF